MFDIYKPKLQEIVAEKLECNALIPNKNGKSLYIFGGDYLIKGPDEQIYPVDKRVFEFLFKKEDLL